MKRLLLLSVILCGCSATGEKTAQQTGNQPEWVPVMRECAKNDTGSAAWFSNFYNEVLNNSKNQAEIAQKICLKSKTYNKQKVTYPMFLYYTYEKDMSEKCKNAITAFMNDSSSKICK